VSEPVIRLNPSRTTAFVVGSQGAVGAVREQSSGLVEIYDTVEEFLKAEKEPHGFRPQEVMHLYKVHAHVLELLIARLEDDPQFAEVVSQLRREAPMGGTWARTSPDGKQEAVATGRSKVFQDRNDIRVIHDHWFYAQA
jgi:hypothetical protein